MPWSWHGPQISSLSRIGAVQRRLPTLGSDADLGPSLWGREMPRRLDEIDAGSATLIDREELSRRMRERLKRS